MAFNTTLEEQEAQGAKDLAKKLMLEARAAAEYRELFERMAGDLLAFVSVSGRPPSAQSYADDLRGLLSVQYRRTMTAFSGSLLNEVEESEDDDELVLLLGSLAAAQDSSLGALVQTMRNQTQVSAQEAVRLRVGREVQLITNTNQREMDKAVQDAALALAADGEPVTNPEVAAVAAGLFLDRADSRANTIAATETQWASEEIKEIELEAFTRTTTGFTASAAGIVVPGVDVVWISMEDGRVRPAHVEAHGQIRDESGVFTVMGQLLRVPGDTTLGATAENVINCRCSAVFVAREMALAA